MSLSLGSLHSASVEILSLHSAGKEDSIFKISLLRFECVVSVHFVPNVMCMYVYVIVCIFVWGGFLLLMNHKELAVDYIYDGLVIFIQSECEDHRGREGSALGLGTAGMTLEEGSFLKA